MVLAQVGSAMPAFLQLVQTSVMNSAMVDTRLEHFQVLHYHAGAGM